MKIELRHVLVPTDFSEPSDAAMEYAGELCKAFGAWLTVLHVTEESWSPPPTDAGYQPPMADLAKLEAEARKNLDEVAKPLRTQKLSVETAWTRGTPFLEIIRYARENGIDLIVMGTHGRGFMAHLLLGSVAENVVRHGPCPVLTVRKGQHAFERP